MTPVINTMDQVEGILSSILTDLAAKVDTTTISAGYLSSLLEMSVILENAK